jgi:hypothetical protein
MSSNNAVQPVVAVASGTAPSNNASTPMAITLGGYTAQAVGNVSPTDNLLAAIAKLEARIALLEAV